MELELVNLRLQDFDEMIEGWETDNPNLFEHSYKLLVEAASIGWKVEDGMMALRDIYVNQ